MSGISKLLFVDTNIWLDFYRARNEAGLKLLRHLEALSDKIIVTYQLEMEYKKHRQDAIIEGMESLKAPSNITRPGILSDASAVKSLKTAIKNAEDRVKKLRQTYSKVLKKPSSHDPVYQAVQRIFHKSDPLVLHLDDTIRHKIRRKAFRRFILGCPPRKKNDTSIGDAINWEWMVHCSQELNSDLVIVSRDGDYGINFEKTTYLNDHLRQEFSDRVSRKKKILLYSKLSDALKQFEIKVSSEEVEVEELLLKEKSEEPNKTDAQIAEIFDELLQKFSDMSDIELSKILPDDSKDIASEETDEDRIEKPDSEIPKEIIKPEPAS